MRIIPKILVLIMFLLMTDLAHTSEIPKDKNVNKGEIINVKTNGESRIIVGNGATIIITNKESGARVLATVVDLKQGGKVRELLNEKEITASEVSAALEATEASELIALPLKFVIEKAYPNPFNPIVNVKFGLPESSSVRFMIHDVSGRLIGDYAIGERTTGWHEFSWNASDMNGQEVGTGVYLLTIQAGNLIEKQKITYIK